MLVAVDCPENIYGRLILLVVVVGVVAAVSEDHVGVGCLVLPVLAELRGVLEGAAFVEVVLVTLVEILDLVILVVVVVIFIVRLRHVLRINLLCNLLLHQRLLSSVLERGPGILLSDGNHGLVALNRVLQGDAGALFQALVVLKVVALFVKVLCYFAKLAEFVDGALAEGEGAIHEFSGNHFDLTFVHGLPVNCRALPRNEGQPIIIGVEFHVLTEGQWCQLLLSQLFLLVVKLEVEHGLAHLVDCGVVFVVLREFIAVLILELQ